MLANIDRRVLGEFLSTSSARRTTRLFSMLVYNGLFLSTSSARRTTRPRAGRCAAQGGFLSTSSARRTTRIPAR